MTTSDASGDQMLFARKATGLVRGWSHFDGFLYAFLVGNTIIGLWVLSFAPFIKDVSVFWSIVLCVAFVFLEVLVYAAWVAVVVMISSYSTGVNWPSAICRRRRW